MNPNAGVKLDSEESSPPAVNLNLRILRRLQATAEVDRPGATYGGLVQARQCCRRQGRTFAIFEDHRWAVLRHPDQSTVHELLETLIGQAFGVGVLEACSCCSQLV